MSEEGIPLVTTYDAETSNGRACTTKRAVLVSVSAVILVAVILGLGLGLGLHDKNQKPSPAEPNGAGPTSGWSTTWNIDNVKAHLTEFESWGTRAVGTPGSAKSIDYLRGKLAALPCTISSQEFQVQVFNQTQIPTLALNSSNSYVELVNTIDFVQAGYGGNGAHSIDRGTLHQLQSTGCSAGDWTGFPAGNVAVLQSDIFGGTCTNFDKALLAESAGAAAVLFRMDSFFKVPLSLDMQNWPWFEGMPTGTNIPVFFVGQSFGAMLMNAPAGDFQVTLTTNSVTSNATVYNVMCDTTGDEKSTILVGAHYDSVAAGPGVNDNGSGSATLLELARAFFTVHPAAPKNRIRFAWWAAEEMGLFGSLHYAKIAHATGILANTSFAINMDMLGSPNGFPQIHSISKSTPSPLFNITTQMEGPMNKFQALLEAEFTARGFKYDLIPFESNSDYFPFLMYGTPAGGFATGAGDRKTEAERIKFGGLENVAHDPCYHQACDRVANINLDLVKQMGTSMAGALSKMIDAAGVGLD